MSYRETRHNSPGQRAAGRPNKKDCPQCKRARWLLTLLMLATMSVILYLNQFGQ